jgi:hypothetical protein
MPARRREPLAREEPAERRTFYSTCGWQAPAQRRRGNRTPARAQGEPVAAARRRGGDERVEMSEYCRVRLLQLAFDPSATICIQGQAIGIDVGEEDYADAILNKCRRNGLLVSTEGATVLLPSLAIHKRTAAEGWTFWRARYDAAGGESERPARESGAHRLEGGVMNRVCLARC